MLAVAEEGGLDFGGRGSEGAEGRRKRESEGKEEDCMSDCWCSFVFISFFGGGGLGFGGTFVVAEEMEEDKESFAVFVVFRLFSPKEDEADFAL